MPALAHIRSTLPHSLVARSTIAVPPALRISSTTASAGDSDPPLPSRAPPKSLTTTLAPRLANPSACARPRPLPAPVTMATRPSNLIVMIVVPGCGVLRHARPKQSALRRLRKLVCDAGHPCLFGCRIKQDVDGRDKPGRDALRLSKINQADPVGH